MVTGNVRTEDEIYDLKCQWRGDPCWDIYETEGFEAHREELKAYQEEMQNQWAQERISRQVKRSRELGCSMALVDYIERLEHRLERIELELSKNDH